MKYALITCAVLTIFFSKSFEIPEGIEKIYSDNLKQVYLTKDSELYLYNQNGEHLYSFNDITLGNISHLDVNLALKPLLFYRDVQAIVFLDNTLSQQGATIYPVHHDFSNVTNACHSVDNNFWIFERDNFELIRINRQMQVISKTGNLSLLLGRTINADQILEKDNLLYLRDEEKGIYVFDIYGNWVKHIPLILKGEMEVLEGSIYFLDKGKLFKYVERDFLEYEVDLNFKNIEDVSIQSSTVFTKQNNEVHIHSIPHKP
ncbi:MAG: hypothetical protein AAF487_06760 [Bacteroidota bacterium]